MQKERTLSYTLAQKLDEADLDKVAGGASTATLVGTHSAGVIDLHVDF